MTCVQCDITVAISAQAPHLEAVRARIGGRVHLAIDGDMPALIEKADIAIGAAGASAFERGCLGLPSVIVVVADNQRGIASLMADAGAAFVADDVSRDLLDAFAALRGNADRRVGMARTAAQLVDGRGAARVAGAVMALAA